MTKACARKYLFNDKSTITALGKKTDRQMSMLEDSITNKMPNVHAYDPPEAPAKQLLGEYLLNKLKWGTGHRGWFCVSSCGNDTPFSFTSTVLCIFFVFLLKYSRLYSF